MTDDLSGPPRGDLPLAVVISAGGLGLAAARRLGQRNRLLIVDRNPAALDAAVASLSNDGFDASGAVCDIVQPDTFAALEHALAAHGAPKIVAHVAGIAPSGGDWRTIMDVNLAGAARMEQFFAPRMRDGAVALFVSSSGGHVRPEPAAEVLAVLDAPLAADFLARLEAAYSDEISSGLAYLLSKRGLNRMVCAKAPEWGVRGARIVSLSPGAIASPMGRFENARNPAKRKMLTTLPLGREGTMLEVADAIEFLTSDRASYITGTDLLMDGGLTALAAARLSKPGV
jgi:NAD(P)-dependent dehydrogenase (short-subunit alcohol dehydrogenase family)